MSSMLSSGTPMPAMYARMTDCVSRRIASKPKGSPMILLYGHRACPRYRKRRKPIAPPPPAPVQWGTVLGGYPMKTAPIALSLLALTLAALLAGSAQDKAAAGG